MGELKISLKLIIFSFLCSANVVLYYLVELVKKAY